MIKKGGIIWTIWNLVSAVLYIALGVVMIAQSGNADFQKVAFLITGIFVTVDATLRIATQVLQHAKGDQVEVVKMDLPAAAAGSAELAAGILVILMGQGQSEALKELLRYLAFFIGILLAVLAVVFIAFNSLFIARKLKPLITCILSIVGSALVAAAGVVIIVFAATNGETLVSILFVLFGLLFSGVGALIAFLTIFFLVEAKKVAEALEPKPEEGEVVDEVKPEAAAEEAKPEEPEETKPEEPEEKPEDPADKPE